MKTIPVMIPLSDSQLKDVTRAAADLPQEKRSIFLERLGAMLNLRRKFTDDDLIEITKLARTGLVRESI